MSRMVPDETVEEIRTRSDIVEVIGAIVPLKRAGSGTYKGLCPFHHEKTPSFTVNGAKQSYHCFGCGKGGDVFRFIMDYENVDFPDSIRILASRCGVIIPEADDPADRAEAKKKAKSKSRAYELAEELCKFFERKLQEDPRRVGLNYLESRGIAPDIIKKFRLGYSPNEWTAAVDYAKKLGYTEQEMLDSGAIGRSESGHLYDHFKGRLTFAIWNESGQVIGFSARVLEKEEKERGKYVNSPETAIFKKSRILYALPFARKAMAEQGMAILCEGQLDTIAMHRGGFECAVAPQGTAFTEEHVSLLKRSVDKVILAFDADGAGQKAAFRALQMLLPQDFEVKIIHIPGGKDPDELYRHEGADGIQKMVAMAVDWLDFLVAGTRELFDCSTPSGTSRAVTAVINYLKLLDNPVTCELYTAKAAKLLQVSSSSLRAELDMVKQKALRKYNGAANAPLKSDSAKIELPTSPVADPLVLTLVELALSNENAARQISENLGDSSNLNTTPEGRALNVVLGCACNGEYELSVGKINQILHEVESPELSALLVAEPAYTEAKLDKAIRDCLKKYQQRLRHQKVQETVKKMQTVPLDQVDEDLLRQLMAAKTKK